jgi:23S rRNA pseudouridine2605 synthase
MSDSRSAPPAGERLAKVIARSGLCSRRDAEGWIAEGRVSVNGQKVQTPAFNVTERDRIAVDGKPLAERQGTRLWLYHKPAGLVVTEKDPEGRPTIFEKLAEQGLPRIVSVGRLDINTEGLLLLTNDGGLKRVLELPATGWLRRYRVRAHGTVTQAALDGLKDGMTVEGIKYGPIEATLEREQGSNVWLVLALREGKNREVKNVLAALGLMVNRLIRISYGPFQLGDMPIGAIETVKARVLRDQLGDKLAREAGVDFASDMPEPRRPDRPAPQRPGRPAPPQRQRPEPRREENSGRPRRIHFDDGRPSTEFVPKGPPRRRDEGDERPARGPRPARDARGERPARADRPQRSDRPRSERPSEGFKPRGKGPGGAGRPAGKPGGKPMGRPGGKPMGSRPAGKPTGRPSGPRKPRG